MITALQAFGVLASLTIWASARHVMRENEAKPKSEGFYLVVAILPVALVWFASFALANIIAAASVP